MPREKTLYTFRCKELLCDNYIGNDKWTEHCRNKHGSKVQRYVSFADLDLSCHGEEGVGMGLGYVLNPPPRNDRRLCTYTPTQLLRERDFL